MASGDFKTLVAEGIPGSLPAPKLYDPDINHAPKREDVLTEKEKKLAVKNALRYFRPELHKTLAVEFARELKEYGRIYMYRFRPDYEIKARHIDEYPSRSRHAAAIMLMISNN
ncbi:MAG: urocanate hydratase, partial [Bacteroidales bacterium]|nr:urocanate hydratase [Bacteroidales bacterium]